jgi:hypothetical protein
LLLYNGQVQLISPHPDSVGFGLNLTASTDGTGSSAGFNNPFGIAIDQNGIIYVSDAGGNKIRKIVVQ